MMLEAPKLRRGRKLRDPVLSFTARLLADTRGVTEQHATDLLNQSSKAAPDHLWEIARRAVNDGVVTIPVFDLWLMNETRRRLS
jgi:hypothetical protein